MLKVVPFSIFFFCENFAAMFSKEITANISTTDSCIGFLRERGELRAIPPFCSECNERATEEKDSGRGDKRAWRCRWISPAGEIRKKRTNCLWEHIIPHRWDLLWRLQNSAKFIFFFQFCTFLNVNLGKNWSSSQGFVALYRIPKNRRILNGLTAIYNFSFSTYDLI